MKIRYPKARRIRVTIQVYNRDGMDVAPTKEESIKAWGAFCKLRAYEIDGNGNNELFFQFDPIAKPSEHPNATISRLRKRQQ